MILKNENDIYIYFEVIEQLEPRRILDIGMFLKRIGGISRKAMNREVPEDIQLDGVDFYPEIDFPVWHHMYNNIYDVDSFLKNDRKAPYELAVILGAETFYQDSACSLMMLKLSECVRYVLVNQISEEWKHQVSVFRTIDLQVEGDCYYLLDLGKNGYGYKNLCNDA